MQPNDDLRMVLEYMAAVSALVQVLGRIVVQPRPKVKRLVVSVVVVLSLHERTFRSRSERTTTRAAFSYTDWFGGH
jgi:hypothetical protein